MVAVICRTPVGRQPAPLRCKAKIAHCSWHGNMVARRWWRIIRNPRTICLFLRHKQLNPIGLPDCSHYCFKSPAFSRLIPRFAPVSLSLRAPFRETQLPIILRKPKTHTARQTAVRIQPDKLTLQTRASSYCKSLMALFLESKTSWKTKVVFVDENCFKHCKHKSNCGAGHALVHVATKTVITNQRSPVSFRDPPLPHTPGGHQWGPGFAIPLYIQLLHGCWNEMAFSWCLTDSFVRFLLAQFTQAWQHARLKLIYGGWLASGLQFRVCDGRATFGNCIRQKLQRDTQQRLPRLQGKNSKQLIFSVGNKARTALGIPHRRLQNQDSVVWVDEKIQK